MSEQFKNHDYTPPEKPPVVEQPDPIMPPAVDLELADKKLVALTFDDGPHPTLTPKLLDILGEQNVSATFFVIGSRVEYYPEIVSRAFVEGHQIGNHASSHKNLSHLSVEEIQTELLDTSKQIETITGSKPTIMRPPYGSYNDQVLAHANAAVILWSVDSEDWKSRDVSTVYHHVTQQVQDGDIVLLHDIHETTIEAVESIILKLKEEDFVFVTVDQLIEVRASLHDGQVYYKVPKFD